MITDVIDDLYCAVQCNRINPRELNKLFAEARGMHRTTTNPEDATFLIALCKEINHYLEKCEGGSPQRHFNDGVYRSYHDFRS
jgi:hypothetical protein